jgi:tRNA A37 methylthiotransferase MiaB
MNEFREGLSKGYKDFALMGTDLGSYGRDANHNLVDLLKEMVKEEGEYRIGLRNLNPYLCNQMLDELVPIFATGKIWYTEIPAESGSNRILKLMGRRYTIETYKEVVRRLREACPTLKVRTQIMVGFPTETNDDFVQSIDLMNDMNFDYVEVFGFSPRIGTAAEKIQGRVSNITIRFREYRIKSKLMFDGIKKSLRHPSSLRIEHLSDDHETLNITSRINA